jgi:signal transduction histidine kinase
MRKIFDPFVTNRETGTGLGLSIVKKIIENHGGTIDVKSPPPNYDVGSIFTITLPMQFND